MSFPDTHRARRLLAALAFSAASLVPFAALAETFVSERGGFAIDVPALFGEPSPSADGLSVAFSDASGEVGLTVFQWDAESGNMKSVAREISDELKDLRTTTYQRVTSKWMVMSGYLAAETDDRVIFYERTEPLPGGKLVTMRVTWPESRRADVDGLMKGLGASLRPL